MEHSTESRCEYEYPTKFNKYRRMMEKSSTNTSSKLESSSDGQKESSNESTRFSSAESSSTHDMSTLNNNNNNNNNNINNSSNNNNNSSNGYSLLQPSFHHSPPKKIFISRACDPYCQDVPLNLTTRSSQRQDQERNNISPVADDDKDGDEDDADVENSSVEAMDVNSMSESMIIEDHFKRSLGNLYTSQLKDQKPSPSYNYAVSASNNNNNNNNGSSSHSCNNSSNNNNSTPSLSSHFNFAMSAIFSPVQLTSNPPFISSSSSSSSPTHFSPHPFAGLLSGSQLHDAQLHGNRFLGGHLNGFSGNVLFNGHHHHHHQQQQQQLHQQAVEQLNKRANPTALPSTSSSSSLHHSSSFNGVRPKKPSSPSSKSTTRHRFTPPDSYQPYPIDVKHRSEVMLKSSASNDASSVSGCVDDHFSKSLGEVWKRVKESNLSEELEELMPTSVDDHFAKALGDKWYKLKSDQVRLNAVESPKKLSPHRNPNFFSSPSSFVVRS